LRLPTVKVNPQLKTTLIRQDAQEERAGVEVASFVPPKEFVNSFVNKNTIKDPSLILILTSRTPYPTLTKKHQEPMASTAVQF
jgi:hypothetical protein